MRKGQGSESNGQINRQMEKDERSRVAGGGGGRERDSIH